MFDDDNKFKEKLLELWNDELEEIKHNKFRVISLFLLVLFAISLIFMEDDGQEIVLNESVQIEEQSEITQNEDTEETAETSNIRVISVKKETNEAVGERVVAVLGANSDALYVSDPFQSTEVFIDNEQENPKTHDVPQQTPVLPPQLPPIPDQNSNIQAIPTQSPELPPIPSMNSQMIAEVTQPNYEFILSGTAISESNKSAIIKKVSTAQGQNRREEDFILSVGDFLEGQQIIDITSGNVFLDDGSVIHASYLESYIQITNDTNTEENDNIPPKYQENPQNLEDLSELNIRQIPVMPPDYEENLPNDEINESVLSPPNDPQETFLNVENNPDLIQDIPENFNELNREALQNDNSLINASDNLASVTKNIDISINESIPDLSVDDNVQAK